MNQSQQISRELGEAGGPPKFRSTMAKEKAMKALKTAEEAVGSLLRGDTIDNKGLKNKNDERATQAVLDKIKSAQSDLAKLRRG